MTVSEAVAEWDEFFYNKLKDQALSGLFSENGSPNYWVPSSDQSLTRPVHFYCLD